VEHELKRRIDQALKIPIPENPAEPEPKEEALFSREAGILPEAENRNDLG